MLYNNILIFFIFVLLFLIFVYPLLNESFTQNNSSVESKIDTICSSIPSGECNSNLCPPQCRPKLDKVTQLCNCIVRIED